MIVQGLRQAFHDLCLSEIRCAFFTAGMPRATERKINLQITTIVALNLEHTLRMLWYPDGRDTSFSVRPVGALPSQGHDGLRLRPCCVLLGKYCGTCTARPAHGFEETMLHREEAFFQHLLLAAPPLASKGLTGATNLRLPVWLLEH